MAPSRTAAPPFEQPPVQIESKAAVPAPQANNLILVPRPTG
jgi:hypothetical protein